MSTDLSTAASSLVRWVRVGRPEARLPRHTPGTPALRLIAAVLVLCGVVIIIHSAAAPTSLQGWLAHPRVHVGTSGVHELPTHRPYLRQGPQTLTWGTRPTTPGQTIAHHALGGFLLPRPGRMAGLQLSAVAFVAAVVGMTLWRLDTPHDGDAEAEALRGGPPEERRVVIVGAGFGGLSVARQLAGAPGLQITVVEPKDYFEYTPGILRGMVDPPALDGLMVPLREAIPPGCDWLRGRAVGVKLSEDGRGGLIEVILSGSSAPTFLPFDELVVSTGSGYAAPIRPSLVNEATMEERRKNLASYSMRIANCREITIIGGGVVGVELAAEIAETFPDVHIDLVNIMPNLLWGLPEEAGNAAAEWLTARAVDLYLDDAVATTYPQGDGSTLVTLRSGRVLEPDLIFDCTRSPPNSGLMKDLATSIADLVDQRGSVKVDSWLQVREGITAFGDVSIRTDAGARDGQTVLTADLGARVVAQRILQGSTEGEALPTQLPRVMCLSLGRNAGLFVANQTAFCSPMVSQLAPVAKAFIQNTKVAEVRQQALAEGVWEFIDKSMLALGRSMG